MSSLRVLRTLCWALVVVAVVAATSQLLLILGLWAGGPTEPAPTVDFVDRLLIFRGNDQEVFPMVLISSLAGLAVFLLGAILGALLRRWAPAAPARDAMVLFFVIGGALGIGANLLNVAVAQAATFTYCDCGYKTEEVIAQDYALGIGWIAVNWLLIGAVTLLGLGAAVGGSLLNFGPAWRAVSYLIAIVLLFAVALRLLAVFVFIEAFDPFQVSDLMVAVAAGILVPIWAVLLARNAGPTESPA